MSRTRPDPEGRSSSELEGENGEGSDDDSPLEEIVAGITIGLILTAAFGLLALGVSWFWIVFPIGFAGVLPAVLGLTKLYERRRSSDGRDRTTAEDGSGDALETLRDRYARGELTDAEFERRLERLVATETFEDATREVRDRTGTRDRTRKRGNRESAGDRRRSPDFDGDVDLEES